MSSHKIEVVPITLLPHGNADSLSIIQVYGWTCVVRTADFQGVALGAYIPPDSLVDPERPEFAFLKAKAKPYTDGQPRARITAAKFRGMKSQGLLVPARPRWIAGQDVADELGVTHYEPPIQTWGPQAVSDAESPHVTLAGAPKYDVENWRRYRTLFRAGESVLASEKIHGASARMAWRDDRLWVGSRNSWKKNDPRSPWWVAARRHPEIAPWCEAHPDCILYGEIYGMVQSLRYGATTADPVRFAAFDVLRGGEWIPALEARETAAGVPWVPTIYQGAYDEAHLETLADGESLIHGAKHMREGIVVKPVAERTDPEIGRVQLKIVSQTYLEHGK